VHEPGEAWPGRGMPPLPAVLHLDAGREWAGGQNQARLLMLGLEQRGVTQRMLCPAGSPTELRCTAEGLPVTGVRWHGPADPRAMLAIGRHLRSLPRPCVIHCHDAHSLQLALVPARWTRTPLVASRRVHYATRPWKWNRADAVVAISGTVEEALVRAGVDARRLHRVHSGVDVDEVRHLPLLDPPLRVRLGVPPDSKLIGNVGHLHGYKGQEIIPRAAALLPRESGVHWVVVGEGPERGALEDLIARLGVGDRVHLTGRLPDARRALREFDLFVFPSTDEALGTSLLDAMAAGCPALAADAAGPAEVLGPLRPGPAQGGLFPVGDAGGLAARVALLVGDPVQRAQLAAAQAARVRDFSAQAMVEGNVALYRSLIPEPPR